MALPELVKKLVSTKLETYCDTKIPVRVRDKIKLTYKIHGNTVFLIESRPAFSSGKWNEMKIARFKYDPDSQTWELFCADRNDKWHSDSETGNEKNFQTLLDAVEEDVTGIYWG